MTLGRLFAGPALDRWLLLLLPVLVQAPGLLHWLDSDPLLVLSPLRLGGDAAWLPGLPGWIDPNVGSTTQALGHLAAQSWLAGSVPWWNPYSGVGVPLAAEMQPAAWFLPFVLLLHFADGLLWLRAAMCAVAGLGTYELLRCLGLRRAACLAGGLLFAFNGTIAWLPHGPDRAAAFLPLILLGIERARVQAFGGGRLGWLCVAAGIAFSLAAGFPETAYLDGLLAGVWTLVRLLTCAPASPPCRSAAAVWRLRARWLGKIASGVVVGLLLAAPAVLPFLQYLSVSDVGSHARGFADTALPTNAFPMFLAPFIYGPISSFGYTPDGPTWITWGNIGGYVGAAAAVLALVGFTGSRARVLRLALAGWIMVSLAKTAALPGVTAAVNLLPMIPQTAFFRYAEPSWSLAAIVLAALAIDDWQRRALSRLRALAGGLAALLLTSAAVWQAWPTIAQLLPDPAYEDFAVGAVSWCVLVCVLTAALLAGAPGQARQAAVLLLVGLDAVAMFAMPQFSATRGGRLDRGPIDFLRSHLGLQRLYSLGAIPANYAALFGLASINHDMLPVPRAWSGYVLADLDPLALPATFSGTYGDRAPGSGPRDMLYAHLDAYRSIGVRYVVTRPGAESLDSAFWTDPSGAPAAPWPLAPGASVSGTLPADFTEGRSIDRLTVKVGTYAGLADGSLLGELCTPESCARGVAALRGAPDNVGVDIVLDPPLQIGPRDRLTFKVARGSGGGPLALWTFRGSAARTNPPPPTGYGLGLALRYSETGRPFKRVFTGRTVEIFELSGAAPYLSADPACALEPAGRQEVVATCPAAAVLTRRELSFPGWRVRLDGHPATLRARGIFQSVALPPGRSRASFRYAPPHIGLAYAAAALGLVWIVLAAAPARFRARLWRRRARAA